MGVRGGNGTAAAAVVGAGLLAAELMVACVVVLGLLAWIG